MAADVLGQRHDADVAAMLDRGEAQRAGPGVVENGGRAMLACDGGERRDVAHFHRQAAGAFQHHGPGPVGEQRGKTFEIQRIERDGRDSVRLEQTHRDIAGRLVGVVGEKYLVARTRQREQ